MQKERIITIVIAVIIAIIITAIAGFIIYRFIFRRQKDTPTIDDTSPDNETDETTDDEQNENENDITDVREDDLHGHSDQSDSLNHSINSDPSMNPFKGKVDVSDHDIRQFTSLQSSRHGSNESVKVITPTVRDLSMDDVIKNDVKASGSNNRKVNGDDSRGGRGPFRLNDGLFGNTGLFGPPIGVTIVTSKVGTWKENEENTTPKVEEVNAVEMNESSGNTKVEMKDGHVRRRVRKHRKVNHDDVKNADDSGVSETVNVAGESEHEKVEVSYPGFREQIETGDGIGSDMLMSFGDSVYEQSYGYYGVGSGAFF